MATSVTQNGVTFTFSANKTVGQYVDGSYWVAGPVTITSISPASAVTSGTYADGASTFANRVVNGAQINPGNRVDSTLGTIADNDGIVQAQGFDGLPSATNTFAGSVALSNPSAYDAALNVDPGKTGSSLVVTEGSVVKAISNPVPPVSVNAAGRASITDMVVLTVVTSAPAAGSFRPAIALASKASPGNESALNYSIFQNYTAPASAPSFAVTGGYFPQPYQLAATHNQASRNISPSNSHPEYGRDRAYRIGAAALQLNCAGTDAEKRDTLIGLVQLGIDVCGRVAEGGIFIDNGAGNQGFKAPAIIAGLALNNATLKALAAQAETFADDRQTFYVAQSDVDLARYTTDGRPRDPYLSADIGMAEWGEQHIRAPNRDGKNLNAFYRNESGSSTFPGIFAARHISGAKALWDCPAAFDYYENRYWPLIGVSSGGGVNELPDFSRDMRATFGAEVVSSKFIAAAALDSRLSYVSGSTRMTFCSAQPANFAGIAAVKLAQVTPTFTGPAAGSPNGRQITVDAKSGIAATASGTMLFVALDDGTTLRLVTSVPAQALTVGQTFIASAWTIRAADPT